MTHRFTTEKGSFLAVGVLGDSTSIEFNCPGRLFYESNIGEWFSSDELPEGNWQIICTYPGCKEEEAAMVVSNCQINGQPDVYFDYTKTHNEYKDMFKASLLSLASLFEREKLYVENPYGKERPDLNKYGSREQFEIECDQWQQAEERRSDKLVLLKEI